MNEGLGVLISGSIDIAKTVSQINNDLKSITKQLHTLELNVDLGKAQKDIQEFNKNIEKQMSNVGNGSSNVGQVITDSVSINMESLRKNHKEAFDEIDKLTKHYGSAVTSIRKSGGIEIVDGKAVEQLNKYNVALKDASGIVRNFELRNTEDGLQLVDFDEITNIEKAVKETEKLANAMGKGREQSLERQRKEQEKMAQTQAKYSNKAIEDAHKEALAEKKKTDELQHQLQLAQRQAQINVQNLKRRYNPVLTPEDNKALDDYVRSMNNLSATTPNVKRHIQNLNTDFKSISSNVADAGSKVDGFGKQLQIAMARIPIWMIGMTAFYAPLRGLQNAIDQIVTLDGQMVELKRVMDAAPHTYNNLLKESINLSNELGNTVTETQQAMNEWARQGERDSTLSDLAETAVVATNISDIQDTTEAVGVLTAGLKAYKIEASDSMSIIDKLNEVDNNFSITTRDLALSMQRSASVAALYNVSLDELIGMTTAIGQVTRESGNVIGNSLKSILTRLTTVEDAKTAMDAVGVSIYDASGEMRSATDILNDLANTFPTLTKETQASLATTIAGRYQVSR